MMTLGSIPVWVILLIVISPPPPSHGQLIMTAIVALFSGVLGTAIFFAALQKAKTAHEKAAVNATQGSQTIFALAGEIFLLHVAFPKILGILGVMCIIVGMILYAKEESKK